MNAHVPPPANVLRFPVRLRVVPEAPVDPGTALGALRLSGAIDERQHATALAYARLRRRYDGRGRLTDEAYHALKAKHSALIRAAGAERFVLDRLVLDDDPPLACEVERIREALGRVASLTV